jgi:hypothetical protein
MQPFLSDFVLSIIPTFAVSRALLWLTTGLTDSLERLITVHSVSLVLCVVLGTWVFAGGITSPSLDAVALFAPGQAAWLLVDLFRLVLRRRKAGK